MIVSVPADLADFKLMVIDDQAVLWMAGAESTTRPTTHPATNSSGEILIGDDFIRRIPLQMPTTLPSNIASQTVVDVFGNLRWIAYAGDQQIEQDFSLQSFPESFPPAKMSVVSSAKPPEIPLMPWISGDALLVLAAATAAIRQRQISASAAPAAADPRDEKLHLAPLGVRFVAGLVDLAPLLAVVAIIRPVNAANPLASIDAKSLQIIVELAILAYLLHTLAAELICGQSLGKMAFGLRVVGPDGNPPDPVAFVLRNLLRVIDTLAVAAAAGDGVAASAARGGYGRGNGGDRGATAREMSRGRNCGPCHISIFLLPAQFLAGRCVY